jgi:antitoxin MazE
MQIAKWGNSLAVRLPVSVVEALDLKSGDKVDIEVVSDKSCQINKKPSVEELYEKLKRFRGRLPADFKFDRDEANER